MFTLSSTEKYFLYTSVADMRNGINGLSGIVNQLQNRKGVSNEVYIFINKQKTIMKLLHYEFGGYTIYYKRLEQGCYEHKINEPNFRPIKWRELILIVEGVIIEKSKQKRRYLPENIVDKTL